MVSRSALFGSLLIGMTCTALSADLRAARVQDPNTQNQEESEQSDDSGPWYWYDLYEREGFIAAAGFGSSGSVNGALLGYGIRVDSDESLGRGGLWLSKAMSESREDISLTADLALWPAQWGWGGVGPLLGIGLDYRTDAPHEGLGGFLLFGVEVALWSPQTWQLTCSFEHDIGLSSDTRNTARLSLAYSHKRLTIGGVVDKL